ncbi:MAG TPA: GNAT family N-acetyltransferase [Ornithinimicrobium sp.]|uniref:GNAT family N-acetyltransferase n=1 Tax=Ornithinimicrobium sp. TaxID=1977084 RepID=UPI002B495814|nr:GNAT family N-acetyltransferase [Ornithinimicrobium sp.]HKJ10836.1 GNAT family N-acetyltransferase [Ornithinimicrobium sp.]
MSRITVVNNAAASRFEIERDGNLVGHLDYQTQGGTVDLIHAEVDPSTRGEGLGAALVKGALDAIWDEKMTIIASCPFVASYIEQHPEYEPLLTRS